MKKLVMLGAIALLSACPVACINDPTLSEEVPTDWQTSTDTSILTDEEKAKLDELLEEADSTDTVTNDVTDTGTVTE